MVGYYRWGVHVTCRTWPNDSLFEVNPRTGFVHTATYMNTAGPNPVNWGLSSQEEMMVLTFQYIEGDDLPLDVANTPGDEESLQVFPNPAGSEFALSYELSQAETVSAELTDILGARVGTLVNSSQVKGRHIESFNVSQFHLTPGIYFLTFNAGGRTITQRLIIGVN